METKTYSAYYLENTNVGYSQRNKKSFTKQQEAEDYAQELLKELNAVALQSDDNDRVIVEDPEGKVLREWVNDFGEVIEL